MDILRYAVFGVFVASGLVALGSWAVTTRRISPFGRTARLLRVASDPVLVPLERWILLREGNPQNAPWWLLGIVVGGGIVLISFTGWASRVLGGVISSIQAGPASAVRTMVILAGEIVSLALIVRVIGSWIGIHRYTWGMRPVYFLTDWIVEPIRRVMPPFGMFDLSPLVAWFLLRFGITVIVRMLG